MTDENSCQRCFRIALARCRPGVRASESATYERWLECVRDFTKRCANKTCVHVTTLE